MSQLALATLAVAFPGPVILAGVVAALRRRRPPVAFRTVALFLALGLAAFILGDVWGLLADRWLLGRVNINLYYAVITAALPEEGFRYLAIRCGLARRPHPGLLTAMLLGSLVGLTFGVVEHIGHSVTKGWEMWLARSFTSVPYHTLSGAVLGYCVARAKQTRRPWGLAGLALLVLVHGLADWPPDGPEAELPDTPWEEFVSAGWVGNLASLLVVAVLAAVLTRKARRLDAALRADSVPGRQ
jgi:hypothetical protein